MLHPSTLRRLRHALFPILTTLALLSGAAKTLQASDPQPAAAPDPITATDHKNKGTHQVYTDPSSTDDDYIIQGEYIGKDPKGHQIGVQIIALGNGSFTYVSYPGGLPGMGWNGDQKKLTRLQASRSPGDTTVVFRTVSFIAEVDGNKIFVSDPHHKQLMELDRIDRQSPTLNAPPPPEAVVLFHDKGTNHFNGAKVTEEGLLTEGAITKEAFSDFTLHLEFRLPYIPTARGQDRGKSGLLIQGLHEIRLLDSFGLEALNHECGAISQVAAPKLNMCLPPLTWQTLDIDYRAARFDASGNKTSNAVISVKHNGILIHENLEIPHITAPSDSSMESKPGPLQLQNFGHPIRFRNIWVIHKPAKN